MNTSKSAAPTLAAKPNQKNVELPKNSVPKDALAIPGIVPEKRESTQSTQSTHTKPLPPIEARLKKLNEINELADRREVVKEAIQNLAGFYISPDGTNCNLRLQDSKGKTFAIAHPSVIGEMVSLATAKLTTELERIETLIDFSI